MTHAHAEKAANLLIGAAIAGAACYVLKTPSLRRAAWRLAVTGLTGTVPAWFRQEVEQGWRESGGTPTVARPGAGAAATPSVSRAFAITPAGSAQPGFHQGAGA